MPFRPDRTPSDTAVLQREDVFLEMVRGDPDAREILLEPLRGPIVPQLPEFAQILEMAALDVQEFGIAASSQSEDRSEGEESHACLEHGTPLAGRRRTAADIL
eukprot:CAMPEP_0114488660 /NCGR_PEP_ID=MMETSP0109-20121206/1452_1 /TAXON_ID=29199 /ORGANISM="Chlorarachnion reptans, Strain CCCM449" /LENGTH=102 /DNA_ID=CAMNT_0001665075 /DNA_START=920 /DNA_END=1229 /DNA_ORIENTATION=-